MGALLSEIAHHRLALDQLDHERLGRDAAGLTGITEVFSSEELLDVLEVMAEAIRHEDMAPSTRTTKRTGEPKPAPGRA